MTRAFVMYVRPLLEYASPIQFPHLLRYKARIEAQRRFIMRSCGMSHLSCTSRLKALGFQTLERTTDDLVYIMYKVLFDKVSESK